MGQGEGEGYRGVSSCSGLGPRRESKAWVSWVRIQRSAELSCGLLLWVGWGGAAGLVTGDSSQRR